MKIARKKIDRKILYVISFLFLLSCTPLPEDEEGEGSIEHGGSTKPPSQPAFSAAADMPAGIYFAPFEVTLSATSATANIYYTLDPSKTLIEDSQFLYTAGTKINIQTQTELRFFAKEGDKTTATEKVIYDINSILQEAGIYFDLLDRTIRNVDFNVPVAIKSNYAIKEIYFTLDNSIPDKSKNLCDRSCSILLSIPPKQMKSFFVKARAYDFAGHEGTIFSGIYSIKKTPPRLNLTKVGVGNNKTIRYKFDSELNTTITYTLDRGSPTSYTLNTEVSLPPQQMLEVIATDSLGNSTVEQRFNDPTTAKIPTGLRVEIVPTSNPNFKTYPLSSNHTVINDDLYLSMRTDDPKDEILFVLWNAALPPPPSQNQDPIKGVASNIITYDRTQPSMFGLASVSQRVVGIVLNVRAYNTYDQKTEVQTYLYTIDKESPAVEIALNDSFPYDLLKINVTNEARATIYYTQNYDTPPSDPSKLDPVHTRSTPAPLQINLDVDESKPFYLKAFAVDLVGNETTIITRKFCRVFGWYLGFYFKSCN